MHFVCVCVCVCVRVSTDVTYRCVMSHVDGCSVLSGPGETRQ